MAAYVYAAPAAPQNEKHAARRTVIAKTVQGEVDGIGPDFISITYEADKITGSSKSVLLHFEPGMILVQNKRGLKEINTGDIAAVEYSEETEDGRTQLIAKKVIFVKAAVKPAPSLALDSSSYVPAPSETPAENEDDNTNE